MPRQTIRKFASQLYPHGRDGESMPLDQAVKYRAAQALGMDPLDTSWAELMDSGDQWKAKYASMRSEVFVLSAQIALLADALTEGMTGQEAWDRMEQVQGDELHEAIDDLADRIGVDCDAIKPYPCGPEPRTHHHYIADPALPQGWRKVVVVTCPESECPDCTEEVAE